jgi:tetratricopeptide (TPR) repeat protein
VVVKAADKAILNGQYKSAAQFLVRASDIVKHIPSPLFKYTISSRLAFVYNAMGEWSKASEQWHQSFDYINDGKFASESSDALFASILSQYRLGNFPTGLALARKSEAISIENITTIIKRKMLISIGLYLSGVASITAADSQSLLQDASAMLVSARSLIPEKNVIPQSEAILMNAKCHILLGMVSNALGDQSTSNKYFMDAVNTLDSFLKANTDSPPAVHSLYIAALQELGGLNNITKALKHVELLETKGDILPQHRAIALPECLYELALQFHHGGYTDYADITVSNTRHCGSSVSHVPAITSSRHESDPIQSEGLFRSAIGHLQNVKIKSTDHLILHAHCLLGYANLLSNLEWNNRMRTKEAIFLLKKVDDMVEEHSCLKHLRRSINHFSQSTLNKDPEIADAEILLRRYLGIQSYPFKATSLNRNNVVSLTTEMTSVITINRKRWIIEMYT